MSSIYSRARCVVTYLGEYLEMRLAAMSLLDFLSRFPPKHLPSTISAHNILLPNRQNTVGASSSYENSSRHLTSDESGQPSSPPLLRPSSPEAALPWPVAGISRHASAAAPLWAHYRDERWQINEHELLGLYMYRDRALPVGVRHLEQGQNTELCHHITRLSLLQVLIGIATHLVQKHTALKDISPLAVRTSGHNTNLTLPSRDANLVHESGQPAVELQALSRDATSGSGMCIVQ